MGRSRRKSGINRRSSFHTAPEYSEKKKKTENFCFLQEISKLVLWISVRKKVRPWIFPGQAHTLVDSRSTKYHLDSKPHGSVPVLGIEVVKVVKNGF